MTRRVLVTGATGFVGRALVPALAATGRLVRAAARTPASIRGGDRIEPAPLPDLADHVDWAPLLAGVDEVVHLAGMAHRSGVEDAGYDRVIRGATGELARACMGRPIQRFVFVSSIGAQAGASATHAVSEADEPHPVTAYDRAKLAAEAELRATRIPFTILRPALVYGPHVKGNMALLMRISASPWPLPAAAFSNRRSLLALDNLVDALVFCLDNPATLGETYVVADPDPITLAEMITILREAAGRPAPGSPAPPAPFEILLRTNERSVLWDRIGGELVVDPGKLLATGWRPPVETRGGLRATVRASAAEAAAVSAAGRKL
ncbi:MAG: NAD-dependent epimerase/dehydratase family protein [Rhodoplanes sp.]|uniref:NAD-dependent epimerase/dehydratase family protein n=1 Tax=Rhodoplanes sp. TaxID=1968906 RepID=UPI0017D806CB|nr:NAD-dependent epimerase/dehydratase family protein [Rhodoplanes sp.]NVO12692.1 NAD-dependent epimerase/dehydratase family protein [Rhodoplanes sp.]